MTNPREATRTALQDVAQQTTAALNDIDRLLPGLRVCADTLDGMNRSMANTAVQRLEAARTALTEADRLAESAKVLFRTASNTMTCLTPAEQAPPLPRPVTFPY